MSLNGSEASLPPSISSKQFFHKTDQLLKKLHLHQWDGKRNSSDTNIITKQYSLRFSPIVPDFLHLPQYKVKSTAEQAGTYKSVKKAALHFLKAAQCIPTVNKVYVNNSNIS